MSLNDLEYIFSYSELVIGAVVQVLFLLLPINFKNWDDDLIHVLTYVAIQGFAGAFIFIMVPAFLEITVLQNNTLVCLMCSICILAALRALRIIPLEFTYPVKQELIPHSPIQFNEFYNEKRFANLKGFSYDLPDAEIRYNAFREKLLRIHSNESESIIKELINNEKNE